MGLDADGLRSLLTAAAPSAAAGPARRTVQDEGAGRLARAIAGDEQWHVKGKRQAVALLENGAAAGNAYRPVSVLEVIFKPYIAVRRAPALSAPIAGSRRHGVTVHVDARCGRWLRLVDPPELRGVRRNPGDAFECWVLAQHDVHGQLLEVVGGEAPLHLPEVSPAIAPSSTPPPVDIHARACFKVVHSERVFVRAAPSLSGKIAGSAGPDDVVHVDRMRRGFVEAEGGTLLLQEWVKLMGPPNAEAEASANAEVDAVAERWMLVEHATLGVLLRECQPDGSDATRSAFGRKEL